jgi:multiple sugar transport system permease protein
MTSAALPRPAGLGAAGRVLERSGWGPALPFLLPALVGFTVFHLWPTLRGFYLSLTDWNLLTEPQFVGLKNFETLLGDKLFWNAMVVTVEYVVINIGLQTVLALGIAVLLDRLTRSVVIRSVVLLPWLISNVVVALVFLWILDYSLGSATASSRRSGSGASRSSATSCWRSRRSR